MTSAGQVVAAGPPPYFVLIDRALRDEGTSFHYLPPHAAAAADPALAAAAFAAAAATGLPVHRGLAWTTDAPYRETEAAIAAARAQGVLAVEMEAAALYAFGAARGRSGAVLRARHQHDGGRRRRFREGRGGRQNRRAGRGGGDRGGLAGGSRRAPRFSGLRKSNRSWLRRSRALLSIGTVARCGERVARCRHGGWW